MEVRPPPVYGLLSKPQCAAGGPEAPSPVSRHRPPQAPDPSFKADVVCAVCYTRRRNQFPSLMTTCHAHSKIQSLTVALEDPCHWAPGCASGVIFLTGTRASLPSLNTRRLPDLYGLARSVTTERGLLGRPYLSTLQEYPTCSNPSPHHFLSTLTVTCQIHVY